MNNDVVFRAKSSWQKDNCLFCDNKAILEAVSGEPSRQSIIRCCEKEECKNSAADLAKKTAMQLRRIGLDPERVNEIFLDCLFREGEDTSNHIKAEGITQTVGLHPDRLMNHKAEIESMLDELPDKFKKSGGGGWSFLNACNDKHGNQWTGLHQRMEQLFQLGIGIGKVELLSPRETWSILPGGMPYYIIN